MSKHIKSLVSKESKEKEADGREARSENFTAIKLRSPKRSEQTDQQQSCADPKEQKIRPRKIACDRELREKFVAEQAARSDNESDPERPIPSPLHVDPFDSLRSLRTGL